MRIWFLISGLVLSLSAAIADSGKIAFISSRSGNGDIFTMNPDGTGVTNLSNTASVQEGSARWRLDGGKIVYQRTDALWTMNGDGSGQVVLSQGGAPVYPDFHPSGSPVIFSRPFTSDYDICRVNADGTGFGQILSNQYGDYYTRWSPDGSKFTFYTFFGQSLTPEVVVANANGSGQTRLTTAGNSQNASWSPDDAHIVFRSSRDGNNEIYVMNSDGTNQTRLTTNSASDDMPSYSPDGSQIVFVSNRDGNNEIYVMNADGTGQTRLTTNTADDNSPSWVIPLTAGSPTLNVNDAAVAEGDSGTTDLTFTISLTAASAEAVSVRYKITNGTASAPGDYTAQAPATLTFAPGETSKTVNVTVQGDTLDEADETLNLTLFSGAGAFLGDATGIGTITDDDLPPTISIADVSQYEGNSGSSSFVFALTLSAPSSYGITVSYATADGSATQSSDYTSRSGAATFAAGTTTANITVPIIGDTVKEADETFVVNLSAPVNATIADNQATGTIRNDELPTISITGSSVTEGDSGQVNAVFTVTLSQASTDDVSFDFATAPGTATTDVDYVATSGSRTILAGDTSKTISVTVNGDLVNEPDETFFLVLSNPVNAFLASNLPRDPNSGHSYELVALSSNWDTARTAAATRTYAGITGHLATITSAVEQSYVSNLISGTEVWIGALQPAGSPEPGGGFTWITGEPFSYTNWRSGEPNNAAPVGIQDTILFTYNGTWNDISTQATIAHYLVEYDGAPADGTTQAAATIVNDDTPPSLAIDDVQIAEGDGTNEAVFTITVSGVSKAAMSVDVTTQDGTATAGADYQSVTSTIQIPQGQTSATVSIPINADLIDEVDETFKVNLSNPVNATISDAQGIGTITDDDSAPSLSIDDVSVNEGTGGTTNAVFTITVNGASEKPIAVDVITQNGTASAGADYQSVNRTVQVPAGQSSVTVTVPITTDSLDEADETFTVNLSGPVNATLLDAQGAGTITDDDSSSVSIDDVTVAEGDSGMTSATFTVTLSVASTRTITVSYGAIAGTSNPATVGSDFLSTKGTLTFAPGDTTKTITVPVVGDYVSEADETFIVKLSSPINAIISDGQGLGTITNDDFDTTPPTVSFTTSTTTPTGTTPQTGGTVYNVVPGITGVAADAGTGIAYVQLRLYRLTATAGVYEYWNGTDWVIPGGTVAIPMLITTLNPSGGGANVTWKRSTGWPTGSNFADGTYYLNAYAFDHAGKFASSSRNFKKLTDNTAPSVSFTTSATTPTGTTPVSGSTVINTMPTITGIAADSASGVAKVELRLYRPTATAGVYENWTGSTWTGTLAALSTVMNPAAGGASISWSRSSGWPSGVDFADGTYYLRATAYDKAGNLTATLASNFKKVTSAGQALQLFENDEPSQ